MIPEKVIYIPDVHVPAHNPQAVETAIKIVNWFRPDRIVILGDFLDYEPLNFHDRESKKRAAEISMSEEFGQGNKVLDAFTRHCQDLVYIDGNHEDRAKRYVDRYPEVRNLVEPDKGLEFRARRAAGYTIKHLAYGDCYRIGHLYATHGTYTTQNHAKAHVDAFCRNLVYGHIHDLATYTKVSPIDTRNKHTATCLGCLCDTNPGYMRNRPNKWVHCIGVCYFRADGTFNLNPVVISEGAATVSGKVFSS